MTDLVLLPGIIAPARIRYASLLGELDGVNAIAKDLEVYRGDSVPDGYSIEMEVDGLDRLADESGFDRFHVYGHSGGGAIALAYAVTHGARLLSLAVDEPAMDFTDDGNAVYGWDEFDAALAMPAAESVGEFLRLQVASDVTLPAPSGDPPPWMSSRPAAMRAFIHAARSHHVEPASYAGFSRPVLFSRGSRTHPRWAQMQSRLGDLFPDFVAEVYDGLHHLNTSHQVEPQRVAASLRELWARAK